MVLYKYYIFKVVIKLILNVMCGILDFKKKLKYRLNI